MVEDVGGIEASSASFESAGYSDIGVIHHIGRSGVSTKNLESLVSVVLAGEDVDKQDLRLGLFKRG